jgi:hypothetical protein
MNCKILVKYLTSLDYITLSVQMEMMAIPAQSG